MRFEYAIVGAGPAGALAAFTLAQRGRDVALFHWAPRSEKPCGGGVPTHGMTRFGSLVDGVPRNEVTHVRLVGPARRDGGLDEALFELATPLAIFARRDFDEALRRAAVGAGARRIGARVVGLERGDDGFELTFRRDAGGAVERATARFVIAADGAAGVARRRLLELDGHVPPAAEQFSATHTVYPRWPRAAVRSTLEIAYLGGVDGYGWSFPRTDHASLGWCEQQTRARSTSAASLRATLRELVTRGALASPVADRLRDEAGVGALIPSLRAADAASWPVEGRRFALVGDAAGAVDPITREGIHHAMASGAALGECDPLARPGRYAAWYDSQLRPEFVRAARIAPRFFGPRFLTTMVRSLARSEALRDVFRDLVSGTQSYAKLKGRLVRSLPRTGSALLVSLLFSRAAAR
jgi:geranylgeranyl reductase